MFIKTKILATVGPASQDISILKKMIDAGVNGIRLNFSHGNLSEFTRIIKLVRQISKSERKTVSLVGDLQGPKIRVGEMSNGDFELKRGNIILISDHPVVGTEKLISTNYPRLSKDVKPGDSILISDGLIKLRVIKVLPHQIRCKIIEGGILQSRKGLNLPGVKLKTKSITKDDLVKIHFCIKNNIDFIALSFVRSEKDILLLKKILRENKSSIPVIAKIELMEGVKNFEGILKVSDGIMIARGDLGVELEPQEVPLIQKMIIKRCIEERKLVITATQMLESMIINPLPSRAEASDVANAVFDGTDTVMLSGETSIGANPVRVVETMSKILARAETVEVFHQYNFTRLKEDEAHIHSIGKAVCEIANEIEAKSIVPLTFTGFTAIILAKYKPKSKIIAITEKESTCNLLNLYRGIKSFVIPKISDTDKTIIKAKNLLLKEKEIRENDTVVFVGSLRSKTKGVMNLIKVEKA